jgi:hypothetical protein
MMHRTIADSIRFTSRTKRTVLVSEHSKSKDPRISFWPKNEKRCRFFQAIFIAVFILLHNGSVKADPPAGAVTAFNLYISSLEARLARQHGAPRGFLAAADEARLRRGELIVENLTPAGTELPGAMLHHWRGTAFVPGATAEDFERLMKDFSGYPQHYAPQVISAKVLARQGDFLQATMRVRQQHLITVVMDTSYDVTFARLDARHGYSISRSTRIAEIDSPGTPKERALGASEEHGFLWRLNTYWSYEERDGGVYMQIESVTLTRAIPRGLGWAVAPFVESVPRESLEFTLRSTYTALRR